MNPTPAALDMLRHFLLAVEPLPDPDFSDLLKGWEQIRFPRKTLITREGETEQYVYFSLTGIQRGYYIKDGEEFTVAFTYPPSFSGIPESLFTGKPSRYFLEALTASTMLRLPWARMEERMRASRALEHWMLRATQRLLVGIAERQYELLAFSAEERFRALMQRSPHVLNLIPHKYLASYLGLDPSTFSKLLGSIKI